MALASQMPRGRGGIGPSRGPRGPRRGNSRWGWALLVVLGIGAGYWWYSRGHEVATTQPSNESANGAAPVDPAVTASTQTPVQSLDKNIEKPLEKQPVKSAETHTKTAKGTDTPTTAPAGNATTLGAAAQLAAGMKLIEEGKFVQGRKALSKLLTVGIWETPGATTAPDGAEGHGASAAAGIGAESISAEDAQSIRDTLTSINRTLIFSTKFVKDDPLVDFHKVEQGEVLSKITPPYNVPYQAIEVINNTPHTRIRAGQNLKMIRGPFHAVVSEREYRMDLFLRDPGDGTMIYVRSFRVGLGESGSTPVGSWVIQRGGKIANPQWSNPKTGEFFRGGDPANPIGKYWLRLEGTDEFTKTKKGFGIHGTVDPDSIGKQASMGCVRLADADIELVYKLLSDGTSTVLILP